MKISFDLDDILASFQAGWVKFHNENYGMNLKVEDFTDFDYTKVMDITMEEVFSRIFEFYRSDGFKEIEPVIGAQDTVLELAKNHEIYVLTSRSSEIKELTKDWISEYFKDSIKEILFSEQILATGFNAKITKGEICKQRGIDLHIEDAPIYVQDILDVDGIGAVLVEKPWNRNFTAVNNRLHRLEDITKLVSLVETLDKENGRT